MVGPHLLLLDNINTPPPSSSITNDSLSSPSGSIPSSVPIDPPIAIDSGIIKSLTRVPVTNCKLVGGSFMSLTATEKLLETLKIKDDFHYQMEFMITSHIKHMYY